MDAILGIKKQMTAVYVGDKLVPVTIVDTNGCKVSSVNGRGYEIGIGSGKGNNSLKGKYAALGEIPKHRVHIPKESPEFTVGADVDASQFMDKIVTVVAESKGKGFAGVVKRYGFRGGPKTHGQSNKHRAPGSIGAGTDPGRVLKGKRMAGRMGGEKVSVMNKKIVGVQDGMVLVSGAVPGANGSLVLMHYNS